MQEKSYGISRYILLVATLSFLGWAFETGYMFLCSGKWHDRGFMTLPFCPIYGCALFSTYLLAGTPDEPRALLKGVKNRVLRYALYFLLAFFVPSAFEIAVGFVLDKGLGVCLWSYNGVPLNLGGYACVPVSLAWAVLIFLFMKFLFLPIKRLLGRIPLHGARLGALFLLVFAGIDILLKFLSNVLV